MSAAQPSQAIALRSPGEVKEYLRGHLPSLAALAATGADIERVIGDAALACHRDQKLLSCSAGSILEAVALAGQLGLRPGVMGSCYLVPIKGKCELWLGYRGMIDLARRSEQIASVAAHLVHEADRFEIDYGRAIGAVVHVPELTGERGAVVAAWCRIAIRGGGEQVEVMSRAELDAVRAAALAKLPDWKRTTSPWTTSEGEMQRKTVARRALKWAPMSSDLATALQHEDDRDAARMQQARIDVPRARAAAPARAVEIEPPHDPETGEVDDRGDDPERA